MSTQAIIASPKGCRKVAGGNTPGHSSPRGAHPGRGAGTAASPKVARIKLHPALGEKLHVFVPKRPRAMMAFLPLNVAPHHRDLRRADAERTVAILPTETPVADFLVNPFGRLPLDVAQHLGELVRGSEADEQMDVIGNAAHRRGHAVEGADESAEVGVETVAPRGEDGGGLVLRAENEVVLEGEMGGGHAGIFRHPCRGASVILYRNRGCYPRLLSGQPSGLAGNRKASNRTMGNHFAADCCEATVGTALRAVRGERSKAAGGVCAVSVSPAASLTFARRTARSAVPTRLRRLILPNTLPTPQLAASELILTGS